MAELTATPIVALDVSGAREALAMVRQLGTLCGFYKIGGELFTACGPSVVHAVRELGHEVFLDLKFHDIPNTVRGSVRAAVTSGATMVTVHASGGAEMVKAAVEGAQGGCRVMGVTVLTSFDARGLARAWGRAGGVEIGAEVERLAGICVEAGAHGLVCSGQELSVVRRAQPELRPLVPGIRFADGEAHDQARVMTPGAAARGGAAYIVLGRAVTGASDPVEAMGRVLAELRT